MDKEEAIKILKDFHDKSALFSVRTALETLHPELKELEDEMVRKCLINGMKFYYEDNEEATWGTEKFPMKVKDILSWLEKQGNPDINPSEFDLRLNKLLKQFETLPKEELASSLSFYLNVVQNDGTYKPDEKQDEQKLPIEKLPSEMKTIGESLGFTTQKECDEYNQMVSGLIMSDEEDYNNIDPHFGKPINKVKPKFKAGNWYQCTKDFFGKGVTFDKNTAYYCAKEGCLQNEYGCHIAIVKDLYDNFKLWTIQDAKPGDVLYLQHDGEEHIIIYKGVIKERFRSIVSAYCAYNGIVDDFCFADVSRYIDIAYGGIMPATKEQRDLLFAKMKEAGYTFDFDKKELKKIEDEEYNGEDYGIDSLYHAQRILEKTLGSVDGYQSDDGILEHKCAITAVKKLYELKKIELPDVGHEYYSELLKNDKSDTIGDYAYQCVYCMSHDWALENPTWDDVQNACKLGAKWQKKHNVSGDWSEEDEKTWKELIEEVKDQLDSVPAPDCRDKEDEKALKQLTRWLVWIKSIKERIGG